MTKGQDVRNGGLYEKLVGYETANEVLKREGIAGEGKRSIGE